MSEDLGFFFALLLNGASIGLMYALIALGFVLVYKATDAINFAQGEFVMMAGLIAAVIVGIEGMPLIAATPAERTTYPRLSSPSTEQPSRFARRILQSASAIGLRQVFPVQTNRMIVPEMRFNMAGVTYPSRSIVQWSSSTLAIVRRRTTASSR